MLGELFKRYWNPPGEARTIRMTSNQVLTQVRREAHTYSHRKIRFEISRWIDAMMNNDLPDSELEKMVEVINVYYKAGIKKGTSFRKMPSFYQVQLTGLLASSHGGGKF